MPDGQKNTEDGAKSVADIAATLLRSVPEPVDQVEQEDVDDDISELEDIEDIEDDVDDTSEDESPTGGEDEDAEPDDTEGEAEDEDGSDEDDGAEYLDIEDDDEIVVMVDGEEHVVPIGDLKRAYSGEGAIEKRLQEATELRKQAATEHHNYQQRIQQLADQERVLSTALDGLDESLFKPVIPAPPQRLRETDPEQYMRHKEAYEDDQKRVENAKKMLADAITQAGQQRQKNLQDYAQQSAQIIAQEIPDLADPKKAQSTFSKMVETAMAYGYSEQEVNSAVDPRMYKLVYDAMKYRSLRDKTRERNPMDTEPQKRKKVRRLRSGSAATKTKARQIDKNRQQVVQRAKTTGKVADVAATLLSPKR